MQKFRIYKIPCNDFPGTFYCKTMPWKIDNFFYFPNQIDIKAISFSEIDFFYANWVNNRLYKDFEFIRTEGISEKEKKSIPTFFNQNLYDLSRCNLVYPGQPDPIPCRPEDCIGLERAVVHDSLESLCAKLISKITGIPTIDYEIMRLRIPGIDKPFNFSGKV